MFYGEYEHNIDDKNRLTIPVRFRDELAEGAMITRGPDPCLWLFPRATWDSLAEQVSDLPKMKQGAREFRRHLFASAFDGTPDKQGRVLIPKPLLKYANLDKQAIVIGQHEYCEIWKPETWYERQDRMFADPEALAEKFEELGI